MKSKVYQKTASAWVHVFTYCGPLECLRLLWSTINRVPVAPTEKQLGILRAMQHLQNNLDPHDTPLDAILAWMESAESEVHPESVIRVVHTLPESASNAAQEFTAGEKTLTEWGVTAGHLKRINDRRARSAYSE